jgi:hypothetical protein
LKPGLKVVDSASHTTRKLPLWISSTAGARCTRKSVPVEPNSLPRREPLLLNLWPRQLEKEPMLVHTATS